MTPNEYQKLAMRTANNTHWTDKAFELLNPVLGMCGESGEIADMLKKHIHQGHPLDTDKICRELGDVLWYIALGCTVLDKTLEEIMQMNIDKLKARYPDGFDPEHSLHRAEGDT